MQPAIRWQLSGALAACILATACGRGGSTRHESSGTASATPAASAGELAVGQPAPDFSLRDQNGQPVTLAALRGKFVVLYFYPKDETSGCTKEASAFRDVFSSLSQRNAVVIGVSADSDESHRAFAANHQLPFSLVSDPNAALAAKYGVPTMAGIIKRQSFVIGPDGKLVKIYRSVDVTAHAAEILADVR